jgi:hypothetical protein
MALKKDGKIKKYKNSIIEGSEKINIVNIRVHN